jgi:hypothetical protein
MADLELKKYRLEVVKTVFGGLIAVLAVFLTATFQSCQKRQDADLEHKKTVVAERMKVYDDIAPKLNDIYCYYEFVGGWKSLKPEDIIARKRDLDKDIYSYSIVFDSDFLNAYDKFMVQTFSTFSGLNKDAKLRTTSTRPDRGPTTVEFTEEDNRANIFDAYWELQKRAAKTLDTEIDAKPAGKDRTSLLQQDISGR